MKNMILILKYKIEGLFLNRDMQKQIHDIKGTYGATTIKGQAQAKRAQKQIESTASYKLGKNEFVKDLDKILAGLR